MTHCRHREEVWKIKERWETAVKIKKKNKIKHFDSKFDNEKTAYSHEKEKYNKENINKLN